MNPQTATTFAGLVQEFFTDYMIQQRAMSPRTVASYRDTFILLLRFAEERLNRPAHQLT
ncbi:site-specific integrase, partial [Ralstonia solanacearum]|nr:site-specific integrase [Ralstonia solanacearum]